MAVIDTTNVIDDSIFLKSKLEKNMVGDNYYIQNAQQQRNTKWDYLPNRIDIEEEINKQIEYTNEDPNFTSTEVAITSVKNEKGKDLGSDFANLIFKDINHSTSLGKRYRFSFDFEKTLQMSESEKRLNTCIWITINDNKISIGKNSIIRRCNSNIGMIGSPNLDYNNIVEKHYEPCILENDLKNMNIYYNNLLNIPNAEWYVIMQLNYFTNFIKMDDVVILGAADLINKTNNSTYKVKAISKACGDNTFFLNEDNNISHTPLITLALEKIAVDEGENIKERIADNAPIYLVPLKKNTNLLELKIESNNEDEKNLKYFNMYIGENKAFVCRLYNNNQEIDLNSVEISCSLIGTDNPNMYFDFVKTDNSFVILDKSNYNKNNLIIIAKYGDIEDSIQIKLGGIY